MFDYTWNNGENKIVMMNKTSIAKHYMPLVWSEHCTECSAPLCYGNCSLYKKRADGACLRFCDGIKPLFKNSDSLYEGADIIFRRWAKLESPFYRQLVDAAEYKKICRHGDRLLRFFLFLRRIFPQKWKHLCTNVLYSFRRKYILRIDRKNKGAALDTMLLFIVAKADAPVSAFVEIKNNENKELIFKKQLELTTEFQEFRVPIYIEKDIKIHEAYINIHLYDDLKNHNLIIKELEVTEYREVASADSVAEAKGVSTENEKKAKLVIWDLDNTLWDGILVEERDLRLRDDIVAIIRHLDEKGIVNSICSKNDEKNAKKVLSDFGIDELFIFQKINWNPKSINVQQIIQNMNIGADTVVFVDDNSFELEEVKSGNPLVTVVNVDDIAKYVQSERFDVPVTEDSKSRRVTYRNLEKQLADQAEWTGNIDGFLQSCNMRMVMRRPNADELPRCCELLQRTNQLNSSGRRLTDQEVTDIYDSDTYKCYCLQCEDRYGKYGTVGFIICSLNSGWLVVTDFVISCRVANKKIEYAALQHIMKENDASELYFNFVQTDRNTPMKMIVDGLSMEKVSDTQYKWTGNMPCQIEQIVHVVENL